MLIDEPLQICSHHSRVTTCCSGVGRWVHEKAGGITLYGGYPGRDGGHVSQQTSYFDRFWDKGQKSRRYFLFVRRCEPT